MAVDERHRPLFMISVAAELADMHPQTLRMYERRGLISPHRSRKRTRLYSMEDVERLRQIQKLTAELGLNLAGVERVIELQEEIGRLRQRVRELEQTLETMAAQAEEERERIHKSYRAELVRLPTRALVPRNDPHYGRR